mgnify:FL=1
MIIQNRYRDPFINFGFNKQTTISVIDTDIVLYQDEIYKENDYTINIIATGAVVVSRKLNKIVFKLTNTGVYNVRVEVTREFDKVELTSNIVVVNVLTTADSNIVTADSNIILASG